MLFGRTSSVTWYILRVEYGMSGEPIYRVVSVLSQLVIVRTLSGGELDILLGGSVICLSCGAKDGVIGICVPDL